MLQYYLCKETQAISQIKLNNEKKFENIHQTENLKN